MPGVTALAGLPDCPATWFCFYDGTNYGYPRGKQRDCGWQDLKTWGWNDRTSSLLNASYAPVRYGNHLDYGNPAGGHYYDYWLFDSPARSATRWCPRRTWPTM